MDFFEINKIVGAVLGAGLIVFVIGEAGDVLVRPQPLEANAYPIAVEEGEAQVKEVEAVVQEAPGMAQLLASGNLEAGRKTARKCAACHSFDKGGAKRVGPNLWGVVGGPMARAQGFAYSSALAEMGGSWGYDELDRFLARPKDYIAGTKMAFAGLKKPGDRANVILYLRSLSDSPVPLPEAQ